MKKILFSLVFLVVALLLPACSLGGVAIENTRDFTVIGKKDQIEYRPFNQSNYQYLSEDIQALKSYTWVKTHDSEAALDFGDFGMMFLDKNSIAQIRISDQGVYIVQLKGNGYHAVKPVGAGNYYNVLTNHGLHVVKGTGFGTEGGDSSWTDEGDVIIVDEVTERHELLDEEDVPDGPLWVYGGRTVIVIRRQTPPREANGASGNNVGAGQESRGNSAGQNFDPNLEGSTWRQRARELYRRWRELEAQRHELGDAEFQRRLLGLMNAYLTPMTDEELNSQAMNCDQLRQYLPSALFAIGQLNSTDDQRAAADEVFKDFGGLDGMDEFANHVCDDNVIDSRERQFINALNQSFGG
ncbi:MAG: hypothetical protein ACOZAR_04515 [Patescibacteria group bacterium]